MMEYPIITEEGKLMGCYYENGKNKRATLCSGCAFTKSGHIDCQYFGERWSKININDWDCDLPRLKHKPETGGG